MLKKLEPNSFKTETAFPVHNAFRINPLLILATLVSFTCLAQTNIAQAAPFYGGARSGNGSGAAWNVGWRGGGPAYGYGGGYRNGYGSRYRFGYGWGYPYAVAPVVVGAGFYGAPVYPYAAPLVYAPPEPIVMVSQAQPNVWYYCAPSKAYFPYVQSCTTDWQVLPAMPPSGVHEVKPN